MLRGLNNFSFHGGVADLETLKGFGVQSFRQPLLRPVGHMGYGDGTPDEIRAIVAKFEACGLRTLYIATPETLQYLPVGAWAELLNEPNLGWSPERYAVEVRKALPIAKARGLILWCGSIANLSAHDLDWLARVLTLVPDIEQISTHYYPDSQQRPRPKKGHKTREREYAHLKHVIGCRRWIDSEFGFSTAGFRVGKWWWKKTGRITETQQRDRIREQFDRDERAGAEASYLYQINDGPNDERLHRYGIKTVDGRWKPATEAFA